MPVQIIPNFNVCVLQEDVLAANTLGTINVPSSLAAIFYSWGVFVLNFTLAPTIIIAHYACAFYDSPGGAAAAAAFTSMSPPASTDGGTCIGGK
jgi:hypothetical protein